MDGGHLPLDLMRQSGGIDFTVYRLSCHLLGICLVSMLLLVAALTYIYVSILPPVNSQFLLASVKSFLNALRPSKSKYSTYSYSFQSKHINRHRILNILNQETTLYLLRAVDLWLNLITFCLRGYILDLFHPLIVSMSTLYIGLD